ncbi:hypothetical protein GCM10014715_12130 [Streptomyces spiralis]|uniref:Uncharacterized protein n=1 Tax=Streptomyces spiralis TaxID=66376 RepID=A0A918ZMG4_9ACTN|nr:hypothetical protein GCM10014715_12130 [Streptomyces spiralis]
MPGCCCSNSLPSAVKLSFREAAAKTVTVPVTFWEEDAADPDPDDDEPSDDDEEDAEEQPLRASRAAAPAPATCSVRVPGTERVITVSTPLVVHGRCRALPRPNSGRAVMIMPQVRAVSLLSHRMSWPICM